MLGEVKKWFEGSFSKPFEGFQSAVQDTFFWFIGVFAEGSKDGKKEHGWKGYLFIWPFTIAFVIVLYLIASIFIVD